MSSLKNSIKPGKLFINGIWRNATGGETYTTYNPATEVAITEIAKGTVEDVDEAAKAAKYAFQNTWKNFKGSDRAKLLNKIADLIEEHAEDLAYREAIDMGKLYTDALNIDVPHIANMFRYYAGWSTKIDGHVRQVEGWTHQEKIMAYTIREPLGVVAAITPFNFPMILSVSKFAPALAAGNCIIHKPASSSPLSAIKLAEIMEEAGVPKGVFNLVTGPGGVIGNAITSHPDIDKVAITGSTETGKKIIKDGADTLKHITVELGGKSPNIIFADADLDKAVQTAVMGIFWNKGEVCVAGSRILVEQKIYDAFVKKFVATAGRIIVGDPFDAATQMGPMSSKEALDKSIEYIEIGKKEGATLASGGNAFKINGKGYYMQPTIFINASNNMRIAKEEIFGPVVPVIPFKDFDEAIYLANDTPYGLASGVQTSDVAKAMRAAELIEAGTVWLNTWHYYSPNAPFGGYKQSGYGREQGIEAFESYMQHKTVWLNISE